ncbi:FecR domain-containing protein [Parapedobacter lycopersici]|uniref:FecR family protein n=1 Tax=Parapedobacter lycopersici TaxID=1864939 RepID=UPI00333F4CAE
MDRDAKELLERYRAGQCTKEEIMLLQKWFHDFEQDPDSRLSEFDLSAAEERFKQRISKHLDAGRSRRISFRPAIAAAAMLAVGILAGIYFYQSKRDTTLSNYVQNDVDPGTNVAVLTLGNGKQIALSGEDESTLVDESGLMILKDAEGRLVYKVAADADQLSRKIEYNTIETPKGGQYHVQLADGTNVWLNAASSLTFPSSFVGTSERRVEMTGEAYFEVVKDPDKPFIVHGDKQDIEVLGTSFNISNYSNDSFVKTSLLSGSVKITPIDKGNQQRTEGVVIRPGQQSVLTERSITVNEVDILEVIDWKNGDFVFNKEPLGGLMNKIARWYNVEIIYDAGLDTSQTFTGQVSRNKKLSAILYALESTNLVHFEITGNRVLVKQRQY